MQRKCCIFRFTIWTLFPAFRLVHSILYAVYIVIGPQQFGGNPANLSFIAKRQRAGAVQDASRISRNHRVARSVLECGGPPPLFPETYQTMPTLTGTALSWWCVSTEMSRLRRWLACLCRFGFLRLHRNFQVSDAEDGAYWLVGQAFDFPAVREDNLLDHRQTEAGAFLMGGEVGVKNFLAAFGRDTVAIVPDFNGRFGSASLPRQNLDPAVLTHRLDGIEHQVEQRLAEQLFVRLDGHWLTLGFDADFLFLDVVSQRMHDFVHDGIQCEFRAADFPRARIVDEFIELRGDFVGRSEEHTSELQSLRHLV